MVQLGSVLAIITFVIAAIFALGLIIIRYTDSEEQRIFKAYQKGNLCPLLRYAKEYTSLEIYNATAEEGLDIFFLIKLQRLNNTIPKEYETLDQKKAWLLTVMYNDCYLAQPELVHKGKTKYTTFPEGALQEILNNDTLLKTFASKYYDDERAAVGEKSCIATFARDGNELAKEIIKKAQELWDKHHAEREAN